MVNFGAETEFSKLSLLYRNAVEADKHPIADEQHATQVRLVNVDLSTGLALFTPTSKRVPFLQHALTLSDLMPLPKPLSAETINRPTFSIGYAADTGKNIQFSRIYI